MLSTASRPLGVHLVTAALYRKCALIHISTSARLCHLASCRAARIASRSFFILFRTHFISSSWRPSTLVCTPKYFVGASGATTCSETPLIRNCSVLMASPVPKFLADTLHLPAFIIIPDHSENSSATSSSLDDLGIDVDPVDMSSTNPQSTDDLVGSCTLPATGISCTAQFRNNTSTESANTMGLRTSPCFTPLSSTTLSAISVPATVYHESLYKFSNNSTSGML